MLPTFKYHPDPVATGSVIASNNVCKCCGQARGYIYAGPVYAMESYDEAICPWCIADGSAHDKLGVAFTDEAGIGVEWEDVRDEIREEVAFRTPGFNGWQQEMWWTHCEDAGEFLGRAGRKELEAAGPDAVAAIQASTGLEGKEWTDFLNALSVDGAPTAYLFRCRVCGAFGGYTDTD
jgi:uncharacterized protein CbrC (UPF0167 family)